MRLRRRILIGVAGLAGVLLLAIVSLCIAMSYQAPCRAAAPLSAGIERMKAVQRHCYGPPSVLQVEEVAKPVIQD